MTDTQSPNPIANAVCMHCGYNISGTIPDEQGQVTCPECGHLLQKSVHRAMTRPEFHKNLRRSLLYPCGIWSIITILLAVPVPNSIVAGLAMAVYFLGYPITLLILSCTTWSRLHHKTAAHPRPYPRTTIPLWVLLYALMNTGFFLFVLFIGF